MQQIEVRQLLKKRDGGKIDSYIPKTIKKKEKEQDLMNLLQTWVHCLLHHKNIYPHHAFADRDILGITVPIASSAPLKQYLDSFFQKLLPHLPHLNHLQILILTSNQHLIEINTLHIDNLEGLKSLGEGQEQNEITGNRLQKEIEVKSFLMELNQKLQQGFVRTNQDVTFKMRVGYRMQQQNQKTSPLLLQDWVKRQQTKRQSSIKTSLKANKLNLIYQVSN